MRLGAHVSAAGGIHKAIERATDDGCEAVQVFVKNNNRWKQRAWTGEEARTFRQAYADSDLDGLVAHCAYLINLCSSTQATVDKSIAALADELDRCAQLGVPYLVMHPGSHTGQGEQVGLELIASNLEKVYAQEVDGAWSQVTLLFENTAGQGTNLGYDLEHLAALFDMVHDPSRFGVCFDTCHAHAAGYDLTDRARYDAFWEEFDAAVGIERIQAFHLNDSKKPLGSKRDRHEHIGDGEIGLETFRMLVNDARFEGVPAALETAPHDEHGYTRELELLRGLREQG